MLFKLCNESHGDLNNMQIRPLAPDWTQDLPRYWFDGSPAKTHAIDCLQISFAPGERAFINVVNHYKRRITDQQLQDEIKVFLGQEGWHRRVHLDYNEWLRTQGYDIDGSVKEWQDLIDLTTEQYGNVGQMVTTVALEHYTALLGEWVLSNDVMTNTAHPHFREIYKWHALEEVEHKSVAFDVLLQVAESNPRLRNSLTAVRRRALLLTTYNMIQVTARTLFKELKRDGQLWKWRTYYDLADLLLHPRQGMFWFMIKPWFKFLRRDFHPAS